MSEISIRREGAAGRITLTRPGALNALNRAMVGAISAALDRWRDDAAVALVLIDAEGARAFSAGGDLAEMFHAAQRGDFGPARAFFAEEYRMNARIASYPKPVVALARGFVLGGGVGLACHARHRVIGETGQVGMPECRIGLIPDVGGSLLLARAPGRLGEYLGLSGARIGAGDAIRAGFFDCLVPEAAWPALTADLIGTGDPGVIAAHRAPAPAAALGPFAETIDDAFAAPDLRTISARLEATDWGHGTLRTLRGNSPLSMGSALDLIRAARREPGLEAALRREYRFTWRAASQGEFLEGIRAQVIDKDRAPVWRDSIGSLAATEVAAMLRPLGPEELSFAPPRAAAE